MVASARKISFEEPEMKKRMKKKHVAQTSYCFFDDILFLHNNAKLSYGEKVAMKFGVTHVWHFNTYAILQQSIIFHFDTSYVKPGSTARYFQQQLLSNNILEQL